MDVGFLAAHHVFCYHVIWFGSDLNSGELNVIYYIF